MGNWDILGYAPVRGFYERVMARKARTERKNFLRFLRKASNPTTKFGGACIGFAERVQELHDASHLSREAKRVLFAGVLDDYTQALLGAQKPAVSETAPVLEQQSEEVAVPAAAGGGENAGGPGQDAAGSVPGLATAGA